MTEFTVKINNMTSLLSLFAKLTRQEMKQDSGWCWLVFFCVCVNMFLVFGVHYTYGVLFPSILKEFNQGQGKTAWAGSLASGLLFLSSIVAIKLCEVTSITFTCILGSLLSGTGIIMISVVSNFEWLYLVYGVFFGVGSSFLYTPGLVIIAQWFKKYQTITTGIAAAAAPFGAVVLSPLIQYMIIINGLKSTIKAGGLVYLIISLMCSLSYQPLVSYSRKKNDSLFKSERESMKFKLDFALFKKKTYCLFLVCMMVTNFSYYIPIVFLVSYAEQIGSSPPNASLLITVWSVSSIIGRIAFGKFVSYKKKQILNIYQYAMFFSATVSLVTMFATKYWHLVCYVVLYGLLDGSFIGLISLVTMEIVGVKQLPQGYGIMLTSIGFPIALGPTLTGYINDKKILPPNFMFVFAAVPFFIGSIIMFWIIKWNKKEHSLEAEMLKTDEESIVTFGKEIQKK
ncbi:monocarboxylate transporter 10 [Hydra vulgaris]|uniref:Monocarboxylate transporter 10 n=1 Tax=Hydra vulgaris TaxID=6087 RepID=A0ABM4B4L5_HYDVU